APHQPPTSQPPQERAPHIPPLPPGPPPPPPPPVLVLRIVTPAPGTTAPVASRTVPAMVPVISCAEARDPKTTQADKNHPTRFTLSIDDLTSRPHGTSILPHTPVFCWSGSRGCLHD